MLPLIGRRQIIRTNADDSVRALHEYCKFVDNHLKANQYLIGDQLTVADIFMAGMISPGFMVFHQVFHPDYTSMTRWFNEISNMAMYKEVAGVLPLLDLPFPTIPADEGDSTGEKSVKTRQPATTAV